MIHEESMYKYREQYPEEECFFWEPSCNLCIVNADGEERLSPTYETDEEFLDRLERSKQAGRNLFYEEWTTVPEYRPGAKY